MATNATAAPHPIGLLTRVRKGRTLENVPKVWDVGIAATKLRPPMPPRRLVRRPRLDNLLNTAVDGHVPLILVSAPAGSGKSTLLTSLQARGPESVAWLQAEENDSDPVRFWSYLVQAIGHVHPAFTVDLERMVAGAQGDDLVVVAAIVNKLVEVGKPVVSVIDDYHLITNDSVHRGMERLIERCPQHVTIVLSTRTDPPFWLGRLRVRGQIVEIRGADLRFDAGEASELLGAGGELLDRARLDQLCGRTEGWAAGLVLAGLSLNRTSDPGTFIDAYGGDDRLVMGYLREEIFSTLDADHHQRLLETSILEKLTGELVDSVTQSAGGAKWLADTASTNQLLICLDSSGTWFRYHHLLRDALRLELSQAFPERIPGLHSRAAEWFESRGSHEQGIVHRLAAGDVQEAANQLRSYGPQLLMTGQVTTLRSFLEQLGDVASATSWYAVLYGWCEFVSGHYLLAQRWLDTMTGALPEKYRSGAISLRINISVGRGDIATALAAARQVSEADLGEPLASHLATATGAAHAWAGQADEARRILRIAVQKSIAEQFPTAHVLALVYLAIVEFDSGAVENAQRAAAEAVDTAQGFGLADYQRIAFAYAIRARTSDDSTLARTDALHALDLARRSFTDLALAYVLTICGDTLMGLGDFAGEPLLAEARSVMALCPDPGIAGRYLARVQSRHCIAEEAASPRAVLVEQLTTREMAVLRHLPTGSSQREIASQLFVSLNTVKTHCQGIYRKLGVGDRKAAVQAARDLHIL